MKIISHELSFNIGYGEGMIMGIHGKPTPCWVSEWRDEDSDEWHLLAHNGTEADAPGSSTIQAALDIETAQRFIAEGAAEVFADPMISGLAVQLAPVIAAFVERHA